MGAERRFKSVPLNATMGNIVVRFLAQGHCVRRRGRDSETAEAVSALGQTGRTHFEL